MLQFFVVVSTIVTASLGQTLSRPWVPNNVKLFSDDMNKYINALNSTWKAGHNYQGVTPDYLTRRMGALGNTYPYTPKQSDPVPGLPDYFDGRQHWSYCPSVSKVRDQGLCSICWAFSAAEAMDDRICIQSGGRDQVELSIYNIVGCCANCAENCKDGYPSKAWQYWVKYGVVTGGEYGSHSGCQPYTYAPCGHHGVGSRSQCTSDSQAAFPRCKGYCEGGYPREYHQDKRYGQEFYFVNKNERQMREEIYRNGPVQSEIHLYEDFVHYKSGVYQRYSQKKMGIHAVRLIGWGVENGIPYWLAVNTWGTDWGDGGRFKIVRGSNECQIENSITAGIPKPYQG